MVDSELLQKTFICRPYCLIRFFCLIRSLGFRFDIHYISCLTCQEGSNYKFLQQKQMIKCLYSSTGLSEWGTVKIFSLHKALNEFPQAKKKKKFSYITCKIRPHTAQLIQKLYQITDHDKSASVWSNGCGLLRCVLKAQMPLFFEDRVCLTSACESDDVNCLKSLISTWKCL